MPEAKDLKVTNAAPATTPASLSRHGLERRPLRDWRTLRDLTIMQLAVQAGVSVATVQALEHGRTRPSIETAEKLASALNVFIEQIEWLEVSPVNQPPSKAYRQFPPGVQVMMAAAVFQVLNEDRPLESALAKLVDDLRARPLPEDEIGDAIDRVRQVIEYDRARNRNT